MASSKRTLRQAKAFALVLLLLAIILGVGRTFFDPDLTGAVIGISVTPMFYWLYRNPEVLLATNYREFCKRYDKARDMKYLKGFPLYYVILALAVTYILVT